MTIANIFLRPGLYFGRGLVTIDEFYVFITTLNFDGFSGFRFNGFPEGELLALKNFPRFVVTFYNGEFINRSWAIELLLQTGSHEEAIERGQTLLLFLADRLRVEGSGALDKIVDESRCRVTHLPPLEDLLEEAIVRDDSGMTEN